MPDVLKNKELERSSTEGLLKALKEQRLSEIQEYLNMGVQVNVKIHGLHGTPLGIAVSQLNLNSTKLLLEYGADPNFYTDCSLVEIIMCSLGFIAMDLYGNRAITPQINYLRPVSSSNKHLSVVRPAVISAAEGILELLLCYGLNPHFTWTSNYIKTFFDFQTQAHDLSKDLHLYARKHFELLQNTCNKSFGFALCFHFGSMDPSSPAELQMHLYMRAIRELERILVLAQEQIIQQKNKYKSEINTVLISLPQVIINTITGYAEEGISKQIAEVRLKECKKLLFWDLPQVAQNPSSNRQLNFDK
jgi:hypothetical protein